MKKYILTCLPVVLAAMGSLSADSANGTQAKSGQPANGTMNQITPPALPAVKRAADPYLTAEYIFWKAQQEGLEYAATGISTSPTTSAHGHGSVHRPDFDYESGFKVGFGLKFRHDNWDAYANYTWLFSDDNDSSTHGRSGQPVTPLWYLPVNEGIPFVLPADKAESDWSMHFNVLDLELGRNYNISPRLTLRPHFGLKLAWIDQDMFLEYENANGTTSIEGQTKSTTTRYHFDNDMFGVGIRAGFNTAWFMWVNKGTISQGFSLFGNFAATALYADFDVDQKASFQNTDSAKRTIARFENDSQIVTPVLEWALGLRYQTDFYNENYEFMIQAAWEEQVWFNQNQFSNLYDRINGNLTLEGLTVKAGFSF